MQKEDLTVDDLVDQRWFSLGSRAGAINDVAAAERVKTGKPIVFSAYAYGDSAQSIKLLENSDFVSPIPIELFQVISQGKSGCRIVRIDKPIVRSVNAWVRTAEADRPEIVHFLDEARSLFEERLPAECLEFHKSEEVFSNQA